MTKTQLRNKKQLTILNALKMSFNAGCSYGIASHKDFVQIHEPIEPVCNAIIKRIKHGN